MCDYDGEEYDDGGYDGGDDDDESSDGDDDEDGDDDDGDNYDDDDDDEITCKVSGLLCDLTRGDLATSWARCCSWRWPAWAN